MFSDNKPAAGNTTAQIVFTIGSLVSLGIELYKLLSDDTDEDDL